MVCCAQVLLEGGYNLAATAAGCEATLRVLLGQRLPRFPKPALPCTAALLALQQVIAVQVCPAHVPRCWLYLRPWGSATWRMFVRGVATDDVRVASGLPLRR